MFQLKESARVDGGACAIVGKTRAMSHVPKRRDKKAWLDAG